jgi:CubicO group peptidase (beta-lactamase class C family)
VWPGERWQRITPEQAGLDVARFERVLAANPVRAGGFGGIRPREQEFGAVLTRGGYLVHTWGDPAYKYQSASLGKCFTKAVLGLAVEAGLVNPDEPVSKTWTGRGQLSHRHKQLDEGLHRSLTWRQLVNHQGGFVVESGYHWRKGTPFQGRLPEGVKWTGDPSFDNFAQVRPSSLRRYSSAGYWRMGQALTALWDEDLKKVLDERLFRHLGIPADRWDWTPGQTVHDTKDWYPDFPGYGDYVDPPYKVKGHVVRGGPGWVVMSSEDLARFGLLIATRGVWKGKRLIGLEWLQGHAGLDIHVVAGDPDTLVSIAKVNAKGFPFGQEVGGAGKFSFPKDLIVGPVRVDKGR